jgi:hypothetical protein
MSDMTIATRDNSNKTFTSMHHSFDILIAEEYKSIDIAVLIHHFQYWIMKNKRLGKNQYEGRTWTYQSIAEVAAHFPYWSFKQVERLLRKMIQLKILIKGNFNKTKLDRTVWYAFQNEEKFTISRFREMEIPESRNGDLDFENCNKDTHSKTDSEKDKKEHPFGKLARSFFEKLRQINPKIKPPDFDKWAKQFVSVAKDGNSPEEIEKVIDYIISTKDKPSSNGFCWARTILSPFNLRKHYARIWGEMMSVTSTPSTHNHAEIAKKIEMKFPERIEKDIRTGTGYIEFINGQTAVHLKFGSKDFVEICRQQLKNRKLEINI